MNTPYPAKSKVRGPWRSLALAPARRDGGIAARVVFEVLASTPIGVSTPQALDVSAYLGRIGWSGPPPVPSSTALRALHEAHVGAVPFENLDVLLGRPIRLDLESLFAKLVAQRRGGYCFEQNTLFLAVLEALGFQAAPLAARVRLGSVEPRPRTHMLLRVELAEGPFLADVGFGGDGPLHPVPLEAGRETWAGAAGWRLRSEDELWVLQGSADAGEWTDLYAFTLERQLAVDYEMANHYTSTHPHSRFVRNLVVQRSWRDRRVLLLNRERVVRRGAGAESTAVRDPEHLLDVLAADFDLRFPPGTRFSQPEF